VKPGIVSLTTLAALAPAKLFACAACYGANVDAPMTEGVNWAILCLGVVITTVLGAFLTFLIYAIRKSEALEAANSSGATANTAVRTPRPAVSILNAEPPNPIQELGRAKLPLCPNFNLATHD
jgi:hypothetical protein